MTGRLELAVVLRGANILRKRQSSLTFLGHRNSGMGSEQGMLCGQPGGSSVADRISDARG